MCFVSGLNQKPMGLWVQIKKGKMTNQKKKKLESFMFKWDERSLWRAGGFSWSLEILHGDQRKKLYDQKKLIFFVTFDFLLFLVIKTWVWIRIRTLTSLYPDRDSMNIGNNQKHISIIQDMCAIMHKARLLLSSRDSTSRADDRFCQQVFGLRGRVLCVYTTLFYR